jgi:type IV pilus assembly protein PilV
MKHLWKINAQKGFTLLELLMAITLMAIGLLATATMQSVAMNSNSIANRSTVVTALAQEVMEEVTSRSPKDVLLATPPFPKTGVYDLSPNLPTTDRTIPGVGIFRAMVTVEASSVNLRRISVQVMRLNESTNPPTPYPVGAWNSALAGVHGSDPATLGAFVITDYKAID